MRIKKNILFLLLIMMGLMIGIYYFWGNGVLKQTERTEKTDNVIEMPEDIDSAVMEFSEEELSETKSSEVESSEVESQEVAPTVESFSEVESTEIEVAATQPLATEPSESESAEAAPTQIGDDWSGGDF